MTTASKIRKGCFGVRFASDTDHKSRGWVLTDCDTKTQAIDAADMFLLENGYTSLALFVVDHRGNVVEEVSRSE